MLMLKFVFNMYFIRIKNDEIQPEAPASKFFAFSSWYEQTSLTTVMIRGCIYYFRLTKEPFERHNQFSQRISELLCPCLDKQLN